MISRRFRILVTVALSLCACALVITHPGLIPGDILGLAPLFLLGVVNAQVGTELVTRRPPKFANFTIRGGTWTEMDATKSEQSQNESEEVFNVTGYDRGADVKCEGYPDAAYEPHVLDVLTEIWNPSNGTEPTGWTARLYTITKIERKQFGSRALIFALELIIRDALDATQTTPAP